MVNIKVKSGQLLGYIDGTDRSRGFDFYLLNTSKKVPHINPDRWQWEQTTITDCPYDYFTDDLKSMYYNAEQSKWVYVKLVSESQLALAKGDGSCPISFPQNLSETWER